MKDKDIYDLLKEYKFDYSEEVEESMNDIEKKKLKNSLKLKIRDEKKKVYKKQIISAAAVALIVGTIFSPLGKQVIADIKEKLFFNPGVGLVTSEKEMTILKTPIRVELDKEFLIKSVVSDKSGLHFEVFFESEGAKVLKEISKNIKIKIDGEFVEASSYASSSGGKLDFASLYFETDKILNEVTLLVYDKEVKVNLEKPEFLYSYDEVGETSVDNDILIGINKYFFDNKTYISIWTNEFYENDSLSGMHVNTEDIIVKDQEGNEYKVNSSNISGAGREFYIDGIVDKPLNIKISKISLDYDIRNPEITKVDIPKDNETLEVNKLINVREINKSFIIKEIKNTTNENGEVIETIIEVQDNHSDDSKIVFLTNSNRSGYSMDFSLLDNISNENSQELTNKRAYGIWKEDLTAKEKMFNKIDLEFKSFLVEKSGSWEINLK